MNEKRIMIKRFLPQTGAYRQDSFSVPVPPGATVLQALMFIYDELDSTLAFRYNCRYNRCGLCGVNVDGKPRLACKTKLTGVEEVGPLMGLPLLRDLAVDRPSFFKQMSGLALYPVGVEAGAFTAFHEEPLHRKLMSCLECLCCVSSCPEYRCGEPCFAGPYLFVKLAQLHFNPRDTLDRKRQAWHWGAERCKGCGKCFCPNGINLKEVISLFV